MISVGCYYRVHHVPCVTIQLTEASSAEYRQCRPLSSLVFIGTVIDSV